MVDLRPFSGMHYNKNIPLDKVICPPYDVISAEEKVRFLNTHPYNFIHLTLGDKNPPNYQEISQILDNWIKEGILEKEEPALYLYKQRFYWNGRKESTFGILGLIKLQPFGEDIMPHEQTFQGPKKDRLELLKHCKANFEPIWGIYEDKEGIVSNIWKELDKTDPFLRTKGWDDREHYLWKIPAEWQYRIIEFFKTQKILIADGHHRYEASYMYYNEVKNENAGYVLILLTDLYDPGVKVLPTHRLMKKELKISLFDMEEIFTISEEDFDEEKLNLYFNPAKPLIYYYDGKKLYSLTPKTNYFSKASEKSNLWWALPTTLLQKGVWEEILKIKEGELQEKGLIRFSHSLQEVKDLIKLGDFGSAFLLPAIPLEIIYALSIKGERLPQKSTYFYPKPVSGLVFWKMEL
ncbi:MAG: hypothetical protein CBR30_05325 [Dictyoglomus sp. NZ13-RE01]|nr:MAG: hypothetical protein CBR30_05325 [Dictyoglomus sp. NZ13-RE01]